MESVIIWDCSSYALQTSLIRPENSSATLLTNQMQIRRIRQSARVLVEFS